MSPNVTANPSDLNLAQPLNTQIMYQSSSTSNKPNISTKHVKFQTAQPRPHDTSAIEPPTTFTTQLHQYLLQTIPHINIAILATQNGPSPLEHSNDPNKLLNKSHATPQPTPIDQSRAHPSTSNTLYQPTSNQLHNLTPQINPITAHSSLISTSNSISTR